MPQPPECHRRSPRAAILLPSMVAFSSAEHAWMWTMSALIARRDGARYGAGKGAVARPCDPDDVVRCVDQLYRQRHIGLPHARVLRVWGERQLAPEGGSVRDSQDRILWLEAMAGLDRVLRAKGIVR